MESKRDNRRWSIHLRTVFGSIALLCAAFASARQQTLPSPFFDTELWYLAFWAFIGAALGLPFNRPILGAFIAVLCGIVVIVWASVVIIGT